MKLSAAQKRAVLAARPGSNLVRVANTWAAVWRDLAQPRAARWRGQLVSKVSTQRAAGAMGPALAVWWSGSEMMASTRRVLLELLHDEVLRW